MTMKKKILTTLSVVLILGLAALGILAYLQDEDSDVNVMTLGNVQIEQIEQERNTSGELVDFTSKADSAVKKPLFPAVYPGNSTSDSIPWDVAAKWAVADDEAWKTVVKNDNVVDKFVTVKNTGESAAYVRTIIAYEGDAINGTDIHIVHNAISSSNSDVSDEFAATEYIETVDIDGVRYDVIVYTYKDALAKNESTIPSLKQVYMDHTCTNDDVAKYGDTYDILVLSQAVQADGFADAQTALDTGFGVADEANVKAWFGGMSIPPEVATVDELKAALAAGGTIVLKNDITADGTASLEVPAGVTATLDLNEKTLTNAVSGAPALVNNGTLTIKGEGAIVNGTSDTAKSHTVRNYGTMTIEDGTFGTFASSGAAVVNDGTTTINGGTFASRQESNAQYGQGPAAYAFINNAGTMTINDATLDGPTHGIFGAYAGKLIVNGGKYTLVGNGGMGCYVVYATGDGTKVSLNGGTINTNEPRHNRVFFVYDNGNYFNVQAVNTGKIEVDGARIYLNGVEQTY